MKKLDTKLNLAWSLALLMVLGFSLPGCKRQTVAKNNIMLADVVDAAKQISPSVPYKKSGFHRLLSRLMVAQGRSADSLFMYDNFTRAKTMFVERGMEFYVAVWMRGSKKYPFAYDCNAILLFNNDAELIDHIAFAAMGTCKARVSLLEAQLSDGTDVTIGINSKKNCDGQLVFLYDGFKYKKLKQIRMFKRLSITPQGFMLPLQGRLGP